MVKDIVPDLLKDITETFDSSFRESETIFDVVKKITDKKATYSDAHDYAVETGSLLSDAYLKHLSVEMLPDGKMYYNIADRIVTPTLENNYNLVTDVNEQIQDILNEQANLHIQAQRPELNQDRIKGIVNRLSNEDDFDLVKWLLDDPIVNFTQSIVDDSIKANAEFHYQSGLAPKIIRATSPGACQWCKNLVGTYDYHSEPQDVYRRHENCRCKTDFYPRDGRGRQNVWNKTWDEEARQKRIDFSKGLIDSIV